MSFKVTSLCRCIHSTKGDEEADVITTRHTKGGAYIAQEGGVGERQLAQIGVKPEEHEEVEPAWHLGQVGREPTGLVFGERQLVVAHEAHQQRA